MVIVFDKRVDKNIVDIKSGSVTGGTKCYWQSESANAWVVDEEQFIIRMGADDAEIYFDSVEAMKPYIDQFIALSSLHNPDTKGINTDPFYDRPRSGTIQHHTYENTDIEQDLIDQNK